MKKPRPSTRPGARVHGRTGARPPALAAQRSARLAGWIDELSALARQGLRPDLGLSRLLKREKPDPELRRRLVVSTAAWFRWGGLMARGAEPAESLSLACRLEELAASPAGPRAALLELARIFPGVGVPALPDWILAGLPAAADPKALALALLRPPSLWLRSRDETKLRRGLGSLAAGLRPHPFLAGAWSLGCRDDVYATEGFRQGLFVLQDPASQAIGASCAAQPGERWLDLCAGAGGKCLHLAEQMAGKGLVEALDISAARLEELRRRARRQQVFNLRVRFWDGRRLPSMHPVDGALVDAPCSGSGTLRRNPDIWTRPAPNLDELTALQDSLLDAAAGRVKPGGRLVYATCSLLQSENEDRARAFVQRHPQFRPHTFVNPLDGRSVVGGLRIRPTDGDQDGTFMAQFVRS